MKRLIISEILILSDKERKARREKFDSVRTIIVGGNSTGKSVLIKSIYQTFGAEPAKIHPRWKAAEVKTVVKFAIDDQLFQILRDGNYFAFFTGDGSFLASFGRVTTELAPYLGPFGQSHTFARGRLVVDWMHEQDGIAVRASWSSPAQSRRGGGTCGSV